MITPLKNNSMFSSLWGMSKSYSAAIVELQGSYRILCDLFMM